MRKREFCECGSLRRHTLENIFQSSKVFEKGGPYIEFNPDKSVNTQARTAAMIRLILEEYGTLPDFTKDDFIQYHKGHVAY